MKTTTVSKNKGKLWETPKNRGFWEVIVPAMTEKMFQDNMRVDRRTFHYILGIVGTDMETKDTYMRKAVGIDKKLAMALTVLATNCEYNAIGNMYGQGKTTVHDSFKIFIKSAVKKLVGLHIKFPSQEKFKTLAEEFEQRWQYPMAVGCIDGSHFPIQPPKSQAQDYYNYKGWHSMVALAICDANYKVYWLKTGIPGRCNDSGAFNQTKLFESLEKNEVFPRSIRKFEDTIVQYHLLIDSAFPLKPWLVKTFRFSDQLHSDQVIFNRRHCRARRVIENVFGRLSARWRRLRKTMEFKLEDIGHIIAVAFALNNICEENKINIESSWTINESNNERLVQPVFRVNDKYADNISINQRNVLKNYFNNKNFQPWE